jgi:hypothetical protein
MTNRDDIDDIMDAGEESPHTQEYLGIEVEGLKELDFEGITAPRARMINFGEEFHKWDDKHKIEFLKKLASSMNHAADIMQQERNKLLEKVDVVQRQLENAEKNLLIQKNIVLKAITDNNKAKDEYIQLIQKLEGTVRDQEKKINQLNALLEKTNS